MSHARFFNDRALSPPYLSIATFCLIKTSSTVAGSNHCFAEEPSVTRNDNRRRERVRLIDQMADVETGRFVNVSSRKGATSSG